MSIKDPRDLRMRNQMLLPWSPGRSISTAKAAEILGVSQTTIRSMLEDKTLMGYKIRPNRPNSPSASSVISSSSTSRWSGVSSIFPTYSDVPNLHSVFARVLSPSPPSTPSVRSSPSARQGAA